MKKLALLLLAATLIVPFTPGDANAMRRSDNAVAQQQAKLKAEWARSRKLGGYSNPIDALTNLFRGETRQADIQIGTRDPKRETIWELVR